MRTAPARPTGPVYLELAAPWTHGQGPSRIELNALEVRFDYRGWRSHDGPPGYYLTLDLCVPNSDWTWATTSTTASPCVSVLIMAAEHRAPRRLADHREVILAEIRDRRGERWWPQLAAFLDEHNLTLA